jgi:hypothetical protein
MEAVATYIPHHKGICLEKTGEKPRKYWILVRTLRATHASGQVSPLGRMFEDLEMQVKIVKTG